MAPIIRQVQKGARSFNGVCVKSQKNGIISGAERGNQGFPNRWKQSVFGPKMGSSQFRFIRVSKRSKGSEKGADPAILV